MALISRVDTSTIVPNHPTMYGVLYITLRHMKLAVVVTVGTQGEARDERYPDRAPPHPVASATAEGASDLRLHLPLSLA